MISLTNQELANLIKEYTEHHTALILSLIEMLTSKGVLDDENLRMLQRKKTNWIRIIDQIRAEDRDRVLNSNTTVGSKARLQMAMQAIIEGNLKDFRKWTDLDKKIRNDT